jgi:hypothetical protein
MACRIESVEVTSAYLYTANTLPQILEAIQRAQVPPKFTNPFLQALGFKSTNDRAFINVWKGLGFLEGVPRRPSTIKRFVTRPLQRVSWRVRSD